MVSSTTLHNLERMSRNEGNFMKERDDLCFNEIIGAPPRSQISLSFINPLSLMTQIVSLSMGHSWDTSGQQSIKHGNCPQERKCCKSKSYVL